MGRDADAYLVYGCEIKLNDEYEVPWRSRLEPYFGEDDAFDEEVLTWLVGGLEPKRYSETSEQEMHAYWDEKNALLEKLGVDFLWCGWIDDPEHVLHISESKLWSSWCERTEVASLDVKPGWNEKLKAACEALGIDFEPKWMLLSAYG
jgi:hypothetical protein